MTGLIIAAILILFFAAATKTEKNDRLRKQRRVRIMETGDRNDVSLDLGQKVEIIETPMKGGQPKTFYENSLFFEENTKYPTGGFVGYAVVENIDNIDDVMIYQFPNKKLCRVLDAGVIKYEKFFPKRETSIVIGKIWMDEYGEDYHSLLYCIRIDNWRYVKDSLLKLRVELGESEFNSCHDIATLNKELKRLIKQVNEIERNLKTYSVRM